ncbi:DHA2 family efflux MFS transporter permease subunit [Alsobacter ponti]
MAAAASAGPGTHAAAHMPARRVFAFLAMVFGMFMAILDIQIVSASLAEIQAGLSASAEEIAWVQTSYLIAEVIMIPLSGFLGRVLSTRILFAVSAAGFTAASALCATAGSLEQMIVYRAIQGFIGGGMIPSVFAAAFTIFPPSRRNIVSPLIGLVATLAPTIGPTVGGYLTDLFSWHWLFLVNLIPGIGVTLATWFLIDFDQPHFELMRKFDWWGLLFMGLFLGTTEYVLEEGVRKDWFQDDLILTLTVVAATSGAAFFWRALTAEEPIVDLRAFKDRNFAGGSLFSFVLGIGLYGLTYLYPVYLGRVRGLSALQIGETMFLTGLCMFLTAPLAGRLMGKLDPRVMLSLGLAGFAAGTWIASGITKDWDFDELIWPQVLRGVSLMFCMVPINNLALGTLPPARMKNAAGLYNVMRNLGGAVGLAVINTVLNQRIDLHVERLHERIAYSRGVAVDTLAAMQQSLSRLGSDAETAALAKMAALVRREALVMAFGDAFLLLTVMFVAIAAMGFLLKKPGAPAGGGGH